MEVTNMLKQWNALVLSGVVAVGFTAYQYSGADEQQPPAQPEGQAVAAETPQTPAPAKAVVVEVDHPKQAEVPQVVAKAEEQKADTAAETEKKDIKKSDKTTVLRPADLDDVLNAGHKVSDLFVSLDRTLIIEGVRSKEKSFDIKNGKTKSSLAYESSQTEYRVTISRKLRLKIIEKEEVKDDQAGYERSTTTLWVSVSKAHHGKFESKDYLFGFTPQNGKFCLSNKPKLLVTNIEKDQEVDAATSGEPTTATGFLWFTSAERPCLMINKTLIDSVTKVKGEYDGY
jgi:type IV secretory pathway VirB10-like protein